MEAKEAIIDVRPLEPTEEVQNLYKVDQIAMLIGSDPNDIAWDEMPAIIVSTEGDILDGHHRVLAAIETGLNEWRAIIVDASEFWNIVEKDGFYNAVRDAADAIDDPVTWGAASE